MQLSRLNRQLSCSNFINIIPYNDTNECARHLNNHLLAKCRQNTEAIHYWVGLYTASRKTRHQTITHIFDKC